MAEQNAPIEVPDGWTVADNGKRLELEVETEDFMEAVELVNELAPLAEDQAHHPDLHIEGYNRFRIVTWSHDVGHLTERDQRLANAITDLLKDRGHLGREKTG